MRGFKATEHCHAVLGVKWVGTCTYFGVEPARFGARWVVVCCGYVGVYAEVVPAVLVEGGGEVLVQLGVCKTL